MFNFKQTVKGAIVWCIKSWLARRSALCKGGKSRVQVKSSQVKWGQVRSAFYTQPQRTGIAILCRVINQNNYSWKIWFQYSLSDITQDWPTNWPNDLFIRWLVDLLWFSWCYYVQFKHSQLANSWPISTTDMWLGWGSHMRSKNCT